MHINIFDQSQIHVLLAPELLRSGPTLTPTSSHYIESFQDQASRIRQLFTRATPPEHFPQLAEC